MSVTDCPMVKIYSFSEIQEKNQAHHIQFMQVFYNYHWLRGAGYKEKLKILVLINGFNGMIVCLSNMHKNTDVQMR